tara:strand:+ start:496 stop:753 length:258 start_codon:yes stop_codon:yes gene_type:complete
MKNVKRTLSYSLYALLATCLASCGNDEYGCYESVQEEFPNAITIKRPIGEKWSFVVIDADSSVYYVETMNNLDTKLTQKELIHKW